MLLNPCWNGADYCLQKSYILYKMASECNVRLLRLMDDTNVSGFLKRLRNASQLNYLNPVWIPAGKSWEEELSGHVTMFSKFTDLPKEIRIKIWTYSVTPRIVPIRCRLIRSSREDATGNERFQSNFEYFSGCTFPSIFHTCREARREGLRIYRLIFSTPRSITSVLYNRSLDTIYLSWSEFGFAERETFSGICTISNLIATVPALDIENLEYLAVDIEIWSNAWHTANEGQKG